MTPSSLTGRSSVPPEDRAATLRGILLVLLAMLLFAGMDGATKHLSSDYSVVQILWIRYVVLLVFGLLVARPRGIRRALVTQHLGLQLGRSLLLIVEKAAFVIAWSYLTLADTHAIAAVAPLMVTVLAALLLRERVGAHRALAVATGFGGVLLIIRPGYGVMSTAAVIPLAAAGLFAVYQIVTRVVSRNDGPETSLLYAAVVGAVVMSVIGPFGWRDPTAADWGLLMLVALAGSGAHFALIKALQLAPASALQPFNYSLFLWAVVVGFVGFGDLPDLWTIAGGAIVVASGLYVVRRERLSAQPAGVSAREAGRDEVLIDDTH